MGHAHVHAHGVTEPAVRRSRAGLRAVGLSLGALLLTGLAQVLVLTAVASVALAADVVHNLGDAATAIPLGAAFLLGSARAERWAGVVVLVLILLTAALTAVAAVQRLLEPTPLEHREALALAGAVGFAGNLVAGAIRLRGGRRIHSGALVADGHHARIDAVVSLGVCLSAAVGAVVAVADPLIGLAMSALIVRISVQALRALRSDGAH